MAAVQNETQGRVGLRRRAQDKIEKCACLTQRDRSRRRARVEIGLAFERWRELKAAKGLKSDAQVALCLLDAMKRLPSRPASSETSDKKIRFSQFELQTLIKQEVHCAVKKNEAKLLHLIETVGHLDHGADIESTIQKLEARISTVAKRAEAALAYMTETQKKGPLPPLVNVDVIRPHSDEDQETMSQSKSPASVSALETTKKSLQKLRTDNEALRTAVADLCEVPSPPVLTPYGSPGSKTLLRIINKEPEDEQEKQKKQGLKEEKADSVTVEHLSSGRCSNIPKNMEMEDQVLYPPLPATTFPSILTMEAASYNIPQRPEVHLALIREPPGLSVLWRVEEEDPFAPPMDSYSIYMSTEKVKDSSVFPDWKILGEVKAIDLPMCVLVKRYKPGHKVCVTVVGKDKFGRYGPYSKVVAAAIPD
uniref:activating transcription factor 7-interacting protein 2 isoform X2 n=1 Tax=Monopterus albus TaxID=43700 RepID=UPI0009B3A879|nr:activating transcription factor 7-interacting protein 2 isoform X2 [Monopterus albus]